MVATKEQERQALQQIRKIVEDLGEDSYIGMAFEGVWEIAEENIAKDLGNSCKWYVDNYHDAEDAYTKLLENCDARIAKVNKHIDELKLTVSHKDSIVVEREKEIDELEIELEKVRTEKFDRGMEIFGLKEKLGFAQKEIVELKAKLYDLMFKGD